MRAHEFITEVLDISGPAPSTEWQSGMDSETGRQQTVGQWKDQTGQTVTHEFEKKPNGEVKMTFNRPDPAGEGDYSVNGSGQGKQASIMTGVARNIRDYMKDNPDAHTYNFSSSADSRTKAYDRMIDKVAPQMGFVGTKEYDPELQRTNYSLKRAQDGEAHTPLVQPQTSTQSTASNTPVIKNIVVPPEIGPAKTLPAKGVSLSGRTATSPEDVTHAYRNMSPEELAHAQNNGAFLPNPNTKVAKTWDTTHKYWSSGDEQGHFGRDWKNGADVAKVRVPIDKVLPNTPVNANHAEVFDKATGKWSPVTTPTTAATMKGSSSTTAAPTTAATMQGSSSTTAATKLQQQPGKAFPGPALVNQAFIPSHDNSPNARAFQAHQDYIKRNMPRI
jgi:hypothetical protein